MIKQKRGKIFYILLIFNSIFLICAIAAIAYFLVISDHNVKIENQEVIVKIAKDGEQIINGVYTLPEPVKEESVPIAVEDPTANTESPSEAVPPAPEAAPVQHHSSEAKTAVVAIVVSGIGLSAQTTEAAMELPKEVTFSISPYGSNLKLLSQKLKKDGREYMIDLPVQPKDYPMMDAGNFALITTLPPGENLSRLKWSLSATEGYIGFLVRDGDKYLASPNSMKWLVENIRSMNLLLLIASEVVNSSALQIAQQNGQKAAQATIILDGEIKDEAILERLYAAEEQAKNYGYAIAIARPYPVTIKVINEWHKKLASRNVQLTPVSMVNQWK